MIGQNFIRRQCTIGLICLVLLPGTVNAADFAIASAHPLATEAGIEILASGGNAFDAAIAVTSTLAVVGPYSSGIGGRGFYLLHQQKANRQVMLDAASDPRGIGLAIVSSGGS